MYMIPKDKKVLIYINEWLNEEEYQNSAHKTRLA